MAASGNNPLLDPWERQPGDSPRSYAAFCAYRDMGPARSMKKLLEHYCLQASSNFTPRPPTLSWTTMTTWSQKTNWVVRASAWDKDQERQAKDAHIAALQEMALRQVEQGRIFQAIAKLLAERAEQYIRLLRPVTVETLDEDGQVIREIRTNLTAGDATALLRAAAHLYKTGLDAERLATGEATERVDMITEQQAEEIGRRLGMTKEQVLAEADEILGEANR